VKLFLLFCLIAPLCFAQEITIGAAASLKPALDKIAADYHAAKLTFTFGSSGTLQKQIENGAPIDVFLSAALRQMDALEQRGLIVPTSRTNFIANALVLIVPNDSRIVNSFDDLDRPGVHHLALGETNSVPAGQYAAQTLRFLHLLDVLQPKAVYGSDVRQVLTYVERGDVDAGLVYQSDATSSSKVRVVATAPPASHAPILYCAAVVKDSRQAEDAAKFVRYLASPAAEKALVELGFTPVGQTR
jgi:molybdate transport system substrate-binding protein